jgi:predicted AAA+ superfamily ATPase
VPKLLNVVHQLIESHGIKFALTGSSSRKLRRGSAHLLAGRAFVYNLFPMTHVECKSEFKLDKALCFGTLPQLWKFSSDEERSVYLKSYVATFIQEEIKAEQIVRKLDPFRRFLEVSAQSNAKIINYTNISKDVGVDVKTVQSYYSILEDTLVGNFLEPYHASTRKSASMNPKFYFFDLGVQRALSNQLSVIPTESTSLYGELFESFIINEFIRLNSYLRKDFKFSYFNVSDRAEIDLVISRPGNKLVLVEIKSAANTQKHHIQKFVNAASHKHFDNAEKICICRESSSYMIDDVLVMPWKDAFEKIFG